MPATLREFLATGRLGPLRCGLTAHEVQQILGQPEAASAARKRQPIVWKFGSLQVHLHEGRVCFLGLYFGDEPLSLPAPASLADWTPSQTVNRQAFEQFLLEAGIPFQCSKELTFSDQLTLETSGGVQVIFARDDRGTRLDSIQYLGKKPVIDPVREAAIAE